MIERFKFYLLIRLLRWYGDDIDQFDHFQLRTSWGKIYVEIYQGLPPDHKDEWYREIK